MAEPARPRHRGADPGAYSSLIAPMPYFNNHQYASGKKTIEESPSLIPEPPPKQDLPPPHHERRNSEKLSPEAFLPVKLEVKSRAHRQIGSGMSGNLGGEIATSIGNFNIYQGAQGRELELQHMAAPHDTQTHPQPYISRQQVRGQSQSRLDPRQTARSLATNSSTGQRLGLPFNSIQRTAPKGDKISSTLASQANQHNHNLEESPIPLTTNSNFTSAVIRTTQPRRLGMRCPSTPFQQRHSRTNSTGSSSTVGNIATHRCSDGDSLGSPSLPTFAPPDLSSRAASLSLDSSIQTLRVSSSSEESEVGELGSRHYRSWSYSSSSPNRRTQTNNGGSDKSRLTSDVLSPMSSTSSPSRYRTGSDPYGTRNLGSVAARTSTSVATVPGVKKVVPDANEKKAPTVRHRGYTKRPGHHFRSSTNSSASLVNSSAMEYSLDHSSNTLSLSSSVSHKNECLRAVTRSSLDRSLSSKGSKAKECMEAIIERIMNAQGMGKDATTWEVQKFLEGGGVEALVRGIETLGGHDPGLAFNLMYVLRVTMMEPQARHQAVSDAKGHILVEHVPAVMEAHLNSTPIFRDGLNIMTILLSDPKTVKLARTLMLTPNTLAMVRKVRDLATPGSRENKLCVDFLTLANSDFVNSS
ncbi:Hypothetical protein NocV09_02000440 [Nannochloropsis oceanica]